MESRSKIEDVVLYEKLRELRKQFAHENGWPVYIVTYNRVLHSLATERPTTLEQLKMIKGIGKLQRDTYSGRILAVINEHLATCEPLPETSPEIHSQWSEDDIRFLIKLYDEGTTVDDLVNIFAKPQNNAPKEVSQGLEKQQSSSIAEQTKEFPSNSYTPWSQDDEELLTQLYRDGKSIEELMEIFSRGRGGIRKKLKRLGVILETSNKNVAERELRIQQYVAQQREIYPNAYTSWSKDDDQRLLQLYNEGKSIEELMEIFSRNRGAIRSRLNKLGALNN